MITFRQVADRSGETGSGSGRPEQTALGVPDRPEAAQELWSPAVEDTPPAPQPRVPRYRRLGG